MFDGASMLTTGGTGPFGNQYVDTLLKRYRPSPLVIYSRHSNLDKLEPTFSAQLKVPRLIRQAALMRKWRVASNPSFEPLT